MNKKKYITVIDFKGNEIRKKDARSILGVYYKKGDLNVKDSGDVYFINNRWTRSSSLSWDEINLNYFNNIFEANLITDYVNGVLYTKITNFQILFAENVINIKPGRIKFYVKSIDYNRLIVSNYHLFKISVRTGDLCYVPETDPLEFQINSHNLRNYKESLPYNLNVKNTLLEKQNLIFKTNDENNKFFDKLYNINQLKDYTFGIEFETISGIIPNEQLYNSSLVPLRDGSINGIEYATIPLSGKEGFNKLKEDVELLNINNCDYDETCSLHIHVGGLKRNVSNIMALLKFWLLIENDFFKYQPIFKKEFLASKFKKHYTKPLNSITEITNNISQEYNLNKDDNKLKYNFQNILKYYTNDRHYDQLLDHIRYHPLDTNNNHKWNINTRYLSLNLIPIIFKNKKTVEFRMFNMSLDINLINAYTLLCIELIHFVNNFTDDILKNKVTVNHFYNFICNRNVIKILNQRYNLISKLRDGKTIFDDRKLAKIQIDSYLNIHDENYDKI